ncbi:MAG: guanylate kinase [Bacteroidales bacterium]|nr:guanylate kinase [Bacteroidales bacterium]
MGGKVIIVSAPSGAGKSTIVKHLINITDFQLEFSVSATSRAMRENEENGKDYFFMSIDDFKNKVEEKEFLEWEEVYKNHYYGTLKSEVKRIIQTQDKNVIFDVDVAGGLSIKRFYKENALSLYIQPPSIEELEKRLKNRNQDDAEAINRRIRKAKHEITYARRFDKIIINDDLNTALKEAEQAVRNFLLK